jgi:DNA-binding CsgD family transcriptional regulator
VVAHGCPVVGADVAPPQLRASIAATIRAHWGAGSRLLADIWIPDADSAVRDRFTKLQRAAARSEGAAAGLEALYDVDLRPLLPAIDVPVLVTHRRQDRAVPFAAARDLAAAVSGARLVPLDGAVHPPWLGDADAVLVAVLPFLDSVLDGTDLDGPEQHTAAPKTQSGASPLSAREREVLQLVAAGLSDDEIAVRLVVSPHTVHRHVANIRTKLGQPSRAAAVAYAGRLGLL